MVKFSKFTHHEESRLGADWLWWWVDSSGEAFGMIVQAKRLKRRGRRWHIDFGYNKGEQRKNLVTTGLDLRVAPIYALYLGTASWRDGLFCEEPEHTAACESCERSTVSVVPAIVTTAAWDAEDQETSLALDAAIALEAIADPAVSVGRIFDSNLSSADAAVRELLTTPQVGARRVAQVVFQRVSKIRAMGFSGPSETMVARGTVPMFDTLPDDQGHFTRPYYPEILDGLRREAPDYVMDVLAGMPVPDSIANRVAGIAVFSC